MNTLEQTTHTVTKQIFNILMLIMVFSQGNLFGQTITTSPNHWGIQANTLLTVTQTSPFKLGSGNTIGLWYSRSLNKTRSLLTSLTYRKLIGFNKNNVLSKDYNNSIEFRETLTSTRLTGLKYLDFEVGVRQQAENSALSWNISLRLAQLIGVDGGVSQAQRIKRNGSNHFSYKEPPVNQPLKKTDFTNLNIGAHFQLFYSLNDKLSLRTGAYFGFKNIYRASLFERKKTFYNASISTGVFVQLF